MEKIPWEGEFTIRSEIEGELKARWHLTDGVSSQTRESSFDSRSIQSSIDNSLIKDLLVTLFLMLNTMVRELSQDASEIDGLLVEETNARPIRFLRLEKPQVMEEEGREAAGH